MSTQGARGKCCFGCGASRRGGRRVRARLVAALGLAAPVGHVDHALHLVLPAVLRRLACMQAGQGSCSSQNPATLTWCCPWHGTARSGCQQAHAYLMHAACISAHNVCSAAPAGLHAGSTCIIFSTGSGGAHRGAATWHALPGAALLCPDARWQNPRNTPITRKLRKVAQKSQQSAISLEAR